MKHCRQNGETYNKVIPRFVAMDVMGPKERVKTVKKSAGEF